MDPYNRNRLDSHDEPSLASYGMGSTYGSSRADNSLADAISVEVSLHDDPLSLQPTRARLARSASGNRVSFRNDTKAKATSKRQQRSSSSGKKKNHRHNPSLPEPTGDDPGTGTYWKCLTRFCTCLIPDGVICRPDEGSKQAWREKITIFQIFTFANLIFLFFFGVIPLYFCREENNPLAQYDWYEQSIDATCSVMEYASYVIIFAVAALLALQCICSIVIGCKSFQYRMSDDRPSSSDYKNPVVIMVPCYNEGEKELRKTINSVLHASYPEEHKVLLVVADGIITGRGEYFNTPATLARLLGFSLDSKRDEAYAYKSLGASSENRASVYSGICQRDGKYLKYIVIVKRGTPEEKASSRPGNRGKRDSQLIALGLLNRVHHDRKQSDLDKALCSAFNDLGMPLTDMQYMLALDADTRISVGSIMHMVYNMNEKPGVLACCGETKVDNKASSWVTMIQVYEYFASHHLKKSFESIFGCVTCLPGCFTMYRLMSEDGGALISSDNIYQNYARNDIESLHEKNLYHLGEDRMLTSLLLKHFPDMSLSFVPIASCWTIVPDSFKVLLSQRRRWVNSTFHNMWELLKVNTMCGFCCCSMNTVVLADMICTLILPSSIIYAAGYTYTAIVDEGGISTITIILYSVLFGSQVLIFLVRSRLDYLLWFLIYLILGVPVFYFILPIYSFWHMDDFSWGTTRQVEAKAGSGKSAPAAAPPKSTETLKPVAALAAVKEESRRDPSRRERRPSLGEEYRHKMRSMGAGQTLSPVESRSFEDHDYRTAGSSGSSNESDNIRAAARKKAAKVERSSTRRSGSSNNNNTSKKQTGPIDLDALDEMDLESCVSSPMSPPTRADPPAYRHNQYTLPGVTDTGDDNSDLFADTEYEDGQISI
mmetsp:Transcript_993/g.1643  ORF Transcript_993/g.1643 Transcript_993/m.1643 type:complete len:884 (-) Transcript_993:146-2797(-)